MCTADGFKPRVATRRQIEDRAKKLPHLLGRIAIINPSKSGLRNKADVGFAIENHFGLEGDSAAKPDFWQARIELKTVPLILGPRGYRSNEKTYITAINYLDIAREDWGPSLHVRQKLNTLLVFVRILPGKDWRSFPVLGYVFRDFMKDPSFARLAKADWQRIKAKVKACQAHELSARDGWVLAPATKGADSGNLRSQPCGPRAMKRSFALRQSMTKAVYTDTFGSHTRDLERILLPRGSPELEKLVSQRLSGYVGMTVGRAAKKLGYRASGSSRSYGADVVQLALGATSPRSRIAEFEEAGVTVRRPRVNPSGIPYEEVSFPAFRVADLKSEEWETSTVRPLVESMLFVPLEGKARDTPLRDCVIRQPSFWRPDDEELAAMGQEWTELKRQLLRGQLKGLRRDHIHMRPHGRNAKDTDSVRGRTFTRKSYWLNRRVVASHL